MTSPVVTGVITGGRRNVTKVGNFLASQDPSINQVNSSKDLVNIETHEIQEHIQEHKATEEDKPISPLLPARAPRLNSNISDSSIGGIQKPDTNINVAVS
jgi:hypothetical protein